ncbi:hypothetical protein PV377_45875 [Streptomyces ipomoeae]|uniref:hypothetical protein n=1 Tax=Streptomyces ipomoeae TaxID=103232 RepID=UPI0029B435E4|nr:hypothetical protein [Streptomyces ipomoeae]MDX2846164.1 hypothetical protein [Streptomyces ipomoeae]
MKISPHLASPSSPTPTTRQVRREPTETNRDPYAYAYVVDGRVPARPYVGALAETEGRMGIDGTTATATLTVRVHDAGQHGTTRREAAERLAWGYGVRTRRVYADLLADRLDRHALRIEGAPLAVARFAADLPGLLAAIEAAATAMMRRLAGWMRDSAHGQRWTECHSPQDWRAERRYWRRAFIRHLARFVGPYAPETGAEMPDWSEDWLRIPSRIAQAMGPTIDTEAVRDHMAEALIFAQAVTAEPRPVEPTPEPRTRYASVYDAIHAPQEYSQELGDVITTYGPDPDAGTEVETAAAVEVEDNERQAAEVEVDEKVTAAVVEARAELTEPTTAPPTGRPAPDRVAAAPRIVRRRRPYGSIRTHTRPQARARGRLRPPQRTDRAAPSSSPASITRKAPPPVTAEPPTHAATNGGNR